MPNHVLIVAADPAARTTADVARSLNLTPVVALTEEEALVLMDRERFSLIAVHGDAAWRRIRAAAERVQPMVHVLELPADNGDDSVIRRLMVRYAERRNRPASFTSEERYRFLSSVLESFTGTLDFQQVIRRIVTITREEFGADSGWLLHPVNEQAEFAKVVHAVQAPESTIDLTDQGPVPLAGLRALVARGMEAAAPLVVKADEPDLDPALRDRFRLGSALVQVLRPRDDEPWAFGIHFESDQREWLPEEITLFHEIGRYATLALNNTLLYRKSMQEMAKVTAILDAERETWRRRRAECLANLGLESVAVGPLFDDLGATARRVAEAVSGTVQLFLYHQAAGLLQLVGFSSNRPQGEEVARYITAHPFKPGEGLAGTVFQIGRPLLFCDISGNAVVDFARDQREREVKATLEEQSLIACPIESYGERIGALIVSQSDPRRNFDTEDLEFVQSVAERIGAASHIRNLTRMSQEGHRAAEDLARREVDARLRFEAVLETAPIGVAVISADELRFELANARFLEFAAQLGKVSLGTKVIGLRGNEVIPGFEKLLKRVAESGETRVDEALEIPLLPAPLYINRIVSAVRGRLSGITQSLTVLIQDVTEQVRAKREIEALARMMAERSARLDSILGSMTDGLWVYDSDGTLVDVNQAALTMFGLASRSEGVACGSFESFNIRYPDGRRVHQKDLPQARALRGEAVPDYLAIGRHLITGKDVDISVAAAPIESGGIVGAVLVLRDITALQELDRKKDEFLSVASHELRTPLTTIKGYTQLLAQTVNDLRPEERNTFLTSVLSEIDRMMGLISELLDVSRIETNRLQIHPQPIRWLEFLERRADAFRVQNSERTIAFDAPSEEITVHADLDRMRQVIDNILANAIKYSGDGTAIEIRVRVDEGVVSTSVIDHGIGIPRDEIGQLFERFHRARNVSSRYYGGLGLGLYIARAIVEAHEGSIFVESDEGAGSSFTVRLPLG